MTKQTILTVGTNTLLARNTWEMTLTGDISAITAPGQFINIALEGMYLRRPISVCDIENGVLTIIYKTVGRGTEAMSSMVPGTQLDVLTGLGNGYDLSKCPGTPLVIGGGAGVPPMYLLTKKLLASGFTPKVLLGFNTADEIFYVEKFKALGVDVFVATADGSVGVKGFVTDLIPLAGEYSYFFTCGPEPMLKAIYNSTATSGQMSFEERMGCGFGACMGCSCETKYGNKRICRDGPVLEKEEIIW